jgi:hypothetical protein
MSVYSCKWVQTQPPRLHHRQRDCRRKRAEVSSGRATYLVRCGSGARVGPSSCTRSLPEIRVLLLEHDSEELSHLRREGGREPNQHKSPRDNSSELSRRDVSRQKRIMDSGNVRGISYPRNYHTRSSLALIPPVQTDRILGLFDDAVLAAGVVLPGSPRAACAQLLCRMLWRMREVDPELVRLALAIGDHALLDARKVRLSRPVITHRRCRQWRRDWPRPPLLRPRRH